VHVRTVPAFYVLEGGVEFVDDLLQRVMRNVVEKLNSFCRSFAEACHQNAFAKVESDEFLKVGDWHQNLRVYARIRS
jgi:hypothetical protein